MTERPILFSAPMVRAILAGTKSQTRRVVRESLLEPGFWTHAGYRPSIGAEGRTIWKYVDGGDPAPYGPRVRCPYGVPGDRLWLRETWAAEGAFARHHTGRVWYRADNNPAQSPPRWRPSIFMPRKFSRITLELTAVRVERVQEISAADIIAEGVDLSHQHDSHLEANQRYVFRHLWDSINGKRAGCAWAENPWVWVLAFKRVEG